MWKMFYNRPDIARPENIKKINVNLEMKRSQGIL